MRESFCDDLGDCLPSCPVDAISFEGRDAPSYDEDAVKKALIDSGKFIPWQIAVMSIDGNRIR